MARKFLTPIDLSGLELLNARLQNLAAAPAHAAGRIYFDTTLGQVGISDGANWVYVGDSGPLDAEGVQDIVGAMVGGSETGITVTYDDGTGTLVFDVPTGSETVAGRLELATAAETTAGTDSTRAVHPAGLKVELDKKAASTHSHATSEVTGLDAALSGKASTSHVHDMADVTGLDTALTGKAAATHHHLAVDVTDLTAAIDARINNVVDGAPGALDTLNELAAALGDDPNFAATVASQLSTKLTKFAQTLSTSATTYTVTHDLGTRDVQVAVYANSGSYEEVEVDVERTSTTVVTLRFAVAPAANAYRVVVQG